MHLSCKPTCAPVCSPVRFKLIESLDLHQAVKNTLKQAIASSNETRIWDRDVLNVIKSKYPEAAIIQVPGTLSSFKELNTYEVKILISEIGLDEGITCELSVQYKIDQESNPRKVSFIEKENSLFL